MKVEERKKTKEEIYGKIRPKSGHENKIKRISVHTLFCRAVRLI